MIPISITLKGFLSYKEEQELAFHDSTVWMLTGKNGAGKSTVFDAMRYALYGEHDRGRLHDIIHYDCDRCEVKFVFEAGGKRLRAERKLRRNAASAACALYEDSKDKPIDGTTASNGFKTAIQRYVGLTEDAFCWTVLLRQGRAEALLDALRVNQQGNSNAYKLLNQLIDLSAYDVVKERAKARSTEVHKKAELCQRNWEALPVVSAEAVTVAAGAIESATKQVTEFNAAHSELDALRAPAGSWAVLLAERNRLTKEWSDLETLLADPGRIHDDANRHRFLTGFLPLFQTEVAARSRLDEAEQALKDADKKLTILPGEEVLRSLRERVDAAHQQLPFLRQRDHAVKALDTLERQHDILKQKTAVLPERKLLLKQTEEARVAKELCPLLEALERARLDHAKMIATHQDKAAESERLQREITVNRALQAQVSECLDQARAVRDQAQTEASQCQVRRDAATDALAKREETRGSKTCVYCGQSITEEQWLADFADATNAERDTSQQLEEARQALEAAQSCLENANREKDLVDQTVVQKNTHLTAILTEVKNLEARLGELRQDIQLIEARIPLVNSLTAAMAKAKVGQLAALEQGVKDWEAVVQQQELVTTQIDTQRQIRDRALDSLPAAPLSSEDAEYLDGQATQLSQDEQAHRDAVNKRDSQIALREERFVAWKREQGLLPDVPERHQPLATLVIELTALAEAPQKQAALESADSQRKRIANEQKRNAQEIERIPEKARCPVAELEARLKASTAGLEAARKRHREAEDTWKELVQQEKRRADAEVEMVTADNQAKLWKELDKQLGAPLQNWLLKEAEGHICDYANTYLDAFSQGHMALEPREGSSIPLDMICRNDLVGGRNDTLQGLSGSQKFRVAVSLALALGQFASISSQRIQSVIIDEGFGGLDTDGQREMSSELRNLASRLERLIIVSHQETFADAFENRYDIRIENGGSVPSRVKLA